MQQTPQDINTLTVELLWPSHGASGQHTCKHTAVKFHLQATEIISLTKSHWTTGCSFEQLSCHKYKDHKCMLPSGYSQQTSK